MSISTRVAAVLRAGWRLRRLAAGYAHLPLALLRRERDFVVASYPGAQSLESARRVVVFVHFDRGGRVHDYALHYLRALRESGFEVLFVSNGRPLNREAVARLHPLCGRIVCRRNVGYDFAAYRCGLRLLGDLGRFEAVVLANDSVYGPLFDLRGVLARCDDTAAVWGITDSWSGRYHLQSYFLLLRGAALRHPALLRFWSGVLPIQSKSWIVRRYELGFTQAMLRAGLPCAALFPYRAAAADLLEQARQGAFEDPALPPAMREFLGELVEKVEAGVPLNAMHHFWDHLIARLRCPFIKRELLSRNPVRIPHVHLWQRLVGSVSVYDTELVVRHLQAIGRDRVP